MKDHFVKMRVGVTNVLRENQEMALVVLVQKNCVDWYMKTALCTPFFGEESFWNFLIKLFSERDVKIRARDKPKMFTM